MDSSCNFFQRRRLVLSVRGSCEWSAVLTDVAAEESLLAGGLAHSGMARAARWKTPWGYVGILESEVDKAFVCFKI